MIGQPGLLDTQQTEASNQSEQNMINNNIQNDLFTLLKFGVGRDDLKTLSGQKITVTNTVIVKKKGMITYIGVVSSSISINVLLPEVQDINIYDCFIIKDESLNASTYNITIIANDNVIDGVNADQIINTNGGKLWLICTDIDYDNNIAYFSVLN